LRSEAEQEIAERLRSEAEQEIAERLRSETEQESLSFRKEGSKAQAFGPSCEERRDENPGEALFSYCI